MAVLFAAVLVVALRRAHEHEAELEAAASEPPVRLRRDAHVLVVGGGVAGLAAAYTLLKRGPHIRVTLLDAAPRFGGQIESVERVRTPPMQCQCDGTTPPHSAALKRSGCL